MKDAGRSRCASRALGAGIALAATGFFAAYAIRNFEDIPAVNWEGASPAIAVMTVALAVLTTSLGGCIWLVLLKAIGSSVSWRMAESIFAVAQFGKYLPGGMAQHVGRVLLAREAGIPVPITVSAMLIEAVWLVGVAATLGLVALLLFIDASSLGWLADVQPMGIALTLALTAVAPWVAIRFVNARLPGIAKRVALEGLIPEPGLRAALLVGVLYLACFFLAGLTLKFHAEWLFRIANMGLIEITCLFAVAWVAGYMTPGAPGGLGIREAMVVLLLSPLVGGGAAVGLAVTTRIATALGDLVAFLVGLAVMRHMRRSPNISVMTDGSAGQA